MAIFTAIWNGIVWLFGLLLTPFQVVGGMAKQPWFRWALHFFVVFLILLGLGYLNYAFDLGRVLRAPIPFLRNIWLPLLFLLVYLLAWLGYWLFVLVTTTEEEISEFPEIDSAWEEAVRDLNEAGVSLKKAPLFLVLGRPLGTEEALFAASQMTLTVNQAPRRPDSPIYFYGNSDGVFITCAGASLLGRQSSILSKPIESSSSREPASAPAPARETPRPDPKGPFAGLPPGVAAALGQASGIHGHEPKSEAPSSRPGESVAVAEEEGEKVRSSAKRRPRLLSMTDEVELLTARFRHLCRLIQRERWPYAPINGVLVLIPFAATDSDEDAQQTGSIARRDLTSIREVLRIHCPLFSILCDMERAPGFREFLRRIPQELRQRPMGRDFPLMPDIEREALPGMIESGVQWICRELLRTAVYKLFRLESNMSDSSSDLIRSNARLYELLFQLRQREKHLSRILTRATASESRGPLLFGGVYLAGTGRDVDAEQAFLPGIFRLFLENQNFVSWTSEALNQEARFENIKWGGYATLAFLIVLFSVFGIVFRPKF